MTKLDRLDWNDLRYFLAVARAGTLAGAARLLKVKHSTVGRRLTALERAIGAALVIRENGIQLTPLGESLVSRAEEVERSVRDLQARAVSQGGCIRVAVPTGFLDLFTPHLAELLAEMRRKHPQTSLEFLSAIRPVDLSKGEAELAVRVGPVTDETLVARKIEEVGWSLYASPDYLARRPAPTDPRDLSGHEVLGFNPEFSGLPGAKWIAEHGAGANIALLHRGIEDLIAAAVAGLGLAVLPCLAGDREPKLQRLTGEILGRQTLSIVYRREVMLSKPVQTVMRFVTDILRTYAPVMRGELAGD
ncbi:LysR family transcriptional regulator [Dongia deserti]|uniref:LysR family transcriptional regulator n=1 Tax=Dongia deserti TaxID=2268030 RepID=UPI0013C459D9|nr:LysR substrate-binding domain-containing protein [Dongia deserti]